MNLIFCKRKKSQKHENFSFVVSSKMKMLLFGFESDWEAGDRCEIKIDGKWVSSIIAGTPNLIYDVRTEDGMRFQKFFPSELRWPVSFLCGSQ